MIIFKSKYFYQRLIIKLARYNDKEMKYRKWDAYLEDLNDLIYTNPDAQMLK